MANEFIIKNGFISQGNSVVNGNLTATTITAVTITATTITATTISATTMSATTYLNLPTDIRVTGGTFTNNNLLFTNNTGGTFNILINSLTGLTATSITATTISATTYLNLPTDIRVTGITNSNNLITLTNNTGGTLSTLFNTTSGLTNSGLINTATLSAITITASTSVTTPLIIGGANTGSSITYKTTTSTGATGADHIFQVGTNGNLEGMRILNNGTVGIGTSATTALSLATFGTTGSNLIVDLLTDNNATFKIQNTGAAKISALRIIDTDNGDYSWQVGRGSTSGIGLLENGATVDVLFVTSVGNFGVGNGRAASARIHSVSTTEQLRLGYDASNYFSTTVNPGGIVTFDAIGTGTTFFIFSDGVNVNAGFTANTISATTYFNLPTDNRITGITNNNNIITLTNITGGTISTLFNTVTGLTVSGQLNAGGVSATTLDIKAPDVDNQLIARFYSNSGTRGSFGIRNGVGVNPTTYIGTLSSSENLAIGAAGTEYMRLTSAGNFGFGGVTVPSARVHITGATEQLRIGYSANTYYSTTVGLNTVTFDYIGTGTTMFVFNDNVDINAGLTANTISATTYLNLPTDIYVTGGTTNNSSKVYTFTNNTGGTFNVIGLTDIYVTGGTYNGTTGIATLVNNTGGTFTVTGFLSTIADKTITGITNSNNIITLTNNTGGTLSTLFNTVTGLTSSGLISSNTLSALTIGNSLNFISSATTISATSGTTILTINSARVQTLTGTTGQTFQLPNATGLTAGLTYEINNNCTGNNSNATIIDNGNNVITTVPSGGYGMIMLVSGGTANGIWDKHFLMPANTSYGFTGLTVNGSISATTYLGLPTDIRVTGGTYNGTTGIATLTNNTGGTFTVTGFLSTVADKTITGITNSNNLITLTNNTGGTLSTLFNTVTGLTNSGLISTATLSAITITASTSFVSPLQIGGASTGSSLTLRSTSSTGNTGADIIFQTGTNGGTEGMRILNNGFVGIGTGTPVTRLHIDGRISGNSTPFMLTNSAISSGPGVGFSLYTPNATHYLDRNFGFQTNYSVHGSLEILESTTGITDPNIVRVMLSGGCFSLGTTSASTNSKLVIGNGHISSLSTIAPTVSLTTPAGVTGVTISSNSTDVKGSFVHGGTNAGTATTITRVTYASGYTTAPIVIITPASDVGAVGTFGVIVFTSNTTYFETAYVANKANVRFNYFVIE